MLETRIVEFLLIAGLVSLYLALKKERKRVRILSHFVSGVIYCVVDHGSHNVSEDQREHAARNASEQGKETHEILYAAYMNYVLDTVFKEVDGYYGVDFLWNQFVKHDLTLFDRSYPDYGFPTLYRRFHKYVKDELEPIMTGTEEP